jgi:hypothetical protein
MGRRYFSQKPALVTGDPCTNYSDPFALSHKAGLGQDFPAPLVTEKVGVYIDRQGETLPFFRVLEEIADINYLTLFHFQQGDAFVFVGFFMPVHPAVGPVHRHLIALANHSYNRKDQFRELAEKDL